MKIGYRHLVENNIESNSNNLPEKRKEAWRKFEDVREVLYAKYRELIKDNLRLANASLESAIREIICSTSNEDFTSVVNQWKGVVERYTQEKEAEPMRDALLAELDQFSREE